MSFDPRSIVTTRSLEGEKVTTFEFRYARWFSDWAKGFTPGARDDPYDNLNNLISKLEDELEEIERTADRTPKSPEPVEAAPVLHAVERGPVLLTPTSTAQVAQAPAPAPTPALVPAPAAVQVANVPAPALSPVTAPTSGALLASSGPTKAEAQKKMAFIGTAVATIVLSAVILSQQDASASSGTNSIDDEASSSIPEMILPSGKPLAGNDRKKATPPAPKPSSKRKSGLPDRPEYSGEMLDIDASNQKDLADNVGNWAVIRGRISEIDNKGAIQFANSPLQGFLLEGSAKNVVGSNVHVTGILTSAKSLRVEKRSDIDKLGSEEKIYTLEDESELRGMEGEKVVVRAKVQGYAESESGNSLYLIFHEKGPGFRAGISPQKTGSSTNEEYLRYFIGKEVLVSGRVSTWEKAKGKSGKRLVIRFSQRADIKLANKKSHYTAEDEPLLRAMRGEKVTLRAQVKSYDESDDGKTLYLIFSENGSGFRAGIAPHIQKSSTDREWLQQFIGKEIVVDGKVSRSELSEKKRVMVRFNQKADIKLAQ